jgi:hypothetical protein
MKAEEIYFLNYVKTKILPKYNLTEEDISFDKNEDYFIMRFILQDARIDKMLEWYEVASKLYEEVSTICYIVTKKKMDNLIVASDGKNSENLLTLV